VSYPGVLTSTALSRRTSATCPLRSDGRADQIQAAAPATIGEAKLVPVSTWTPSGVPSGSSAIGVSTGTASPGAATSTAALLLLNDAGASVGPTAATLRTCGQAAG